MKTAQFIAYHPAALLIALLSLAACAAHADQAPKPAPPPQPAQSGSAAAGASSAPQGKDAKAPTRGQRRRAVKLFLEASKFYEQQKFEDALHGFERAAALDPTTANYTLSAGLARSHLVTALVQAAAKQRIGGDRAAARVTLTQALALDPKSIQVTQHLFELGDDALQGQIRPLYDAGASTIGAAETLAPAKGVHSFHLHTDQRQAIQQVYKAFGINVTMDESVRQTQLRLDLDDATFDQATQALRLITSTFYVPVDAHRVLVARDTRENRAQFMRQELETVYLPGLTATEMTDVGNVAKNVFDVPQATVEPSAGTVTLRAPQATLDAFNATMRNLMDGRSQIMLDVRLIQLAHTKSRNTGLQQPQALGLYNVDAEVQSIMSANQALIQQIISSGLAAPGDVGAIVAILVASGQVSSSLFSGGFAQFGGSCPLTAGTSCSPASFALAPGTTTLNFSLNSSDSRELDQIQMRLGDGEAGTLRSGSRYPIQTSSFSSLSPNLPNIPGLTGAGASSALSSLLSQYANSVPNVPQVEYQDLGLTLKATPSVMRNGDVALNIDMKITALAGSSINGNPILNSRAYSGVVTIKDGEPMVVISELDKNQSNAISGTPGVSDIPGLNDVSDKTIQQNYASLLMVMTPHVIRGSQIAGHSPMMRVEKTTPEK